jgi:hypothetical protein
VENGEENHRNGREVEGEYGGGGEEEYVFRNEKKFLGENCRGERLFRFASIYFPENPLDIFV